MPDFRIVGTELVVQCLNQPPKWMTIDDRDGFPGVRVPDVSKFMTRLVAMTLGGVPKADAGSSVMDKLHFESRARQEITNLFDAEVGIDGPGPHRWALRSTAIGTILDKIRWVWGMEAVALQLGYRRLSADGTKDPVEEAREAYPLRDAYVIPRAGGGETRVFSTFWTVFGLEEI